MRRFLRSGERRTTSSESRVLRRILATVLESRFVPAPAGAEAIDAVLGVVKDWARRWDEAVAGVYYRCVRLESTRHAVVPFMRLAIADLAVRVGAGVGLLGLPDALARGCWGFEGQRGVFLEDLVERAGLSKSDLAAARDHEDLHRNTVKSWFGPHAKRPSPEHLESLARFLAPLCGYETWERLFSELQWYYTLSDLVQLARGSAFVEDDHLHEARHCTLMLVHKTDRILELLYPDGASADVRRAVVAGGGAALPEEALHSLCESTRAVENAHCLWGAAVWGAAHDWTSWLRVAMEQFFEAPFDGGRSVEQLEYARWAAPIARLSLRVFEHADVVRSMSQGDRVDREDALEAYREMGHIAFCYHVAGKYENAGPLYHWQLEHNPHDEVACYQWIDCLWRAGHFEDAELAARALCERSPTYTGARHLLVEVLLETGRPEEALAVIDSHEPILETWQWHVLKARALTELGRFEEALGSLGQLLPLEDPPVFVLDLGAECHAQLGGRSSRSEARRLAKLARNMGLDRMASKLEAGEL